MLFSCLLRMNDGAYWASLSKFLLKHLIERTKVEGHQRGGNSLNRLFYQSINWLATCYQKQINRRKEDMGPIFLCFQDIFPEIFSLGKFNLAEMFIIG